MAKRRAKGERNWSAGVRLWIERRGKAILGEGRADLLAAVEQTGSISAGARQVGVSYRHAWLEIQAINEAAGEPLVESAVGGRKGGGARLTEAGREALQIFARLRSAVHGEAAVALPRILNVADDAASAVHIAAAISMQEVVGQLLTEFALARPTIRVRTIFGASNELADYLAGGARADLFVTGDGELLERLEALNIADRKSRRALARNGLSVITSDADGGEVTSLSKLIAAEGLIAVADTAAPLGKLTRRYLELAGQHDALAARLFVVDNSRAVLAAVRSGRARFGIAFSSDAAQMTECRVAFAPWGDAPSTTYVATLLSSGPRRDEAAELLAFFTAKSSAAVFRRCGFLIDELPLDASPNVGETYLSVLGRPAAKSTERTPAGD